MTAPTLPRPVVEPEKTATPGLCHTVCDACYPTGDGPALCGAEPSGPGWCDGYCGCPDCVVCDDLDAAGFYPCCGAA